MREGWVREGRIDFLSDVIEEVGDAIEELCDVIEEVSGGREELCDGVDGKGREIGGGERVRWGGVSEDEEEEGGVWDIFWATA